jgi:hypothetical protein
MLQKLRAYLENTPHEQKVRDWEAIRARGYTGSPNVQDFIASFRHTPAYCRAVFTVLSQNTSAQSDFPDNMESQ